MPYSKSILPTAQTWYNIVGLDRWLNETLVEHKMVALGLPR
jgi:hypothetical protein